ncbi:PREDICTED: WSC domain-containing protein 1-like [Priapulus caudatus]|uniref:WSC domain-containing protein 1-like n=1 Tax=Priapulus caudatus TaxID=37621 RepID=A0ABM1DZB5_PRICU|nr:PREDICTED: WSC domain-containing protein 1-like [Priapulus caudatus]
MQFHALATLHASMAARESRTILVGIIISAIALMCLYQMSDHSHQTPAFAKPKERIREYSTGVRSTQKWRRTDAPGASYVGCTAVVRDGTDAFGSSDARSCILACQREAAAYATVDDAGSWCRCVKHDIRGSNSSSELLVSPTSCRSVTAEQDVAAAFVPTSTMRDKARLYKLERCTQRHGNAPCSLVCLDPIGAHPVVALASAPGSGNTWLRYLIEMTSGVFTGSIYKDKDLMARQFVGERQRRNDGTTIVVKSHKNMRSVVLAVNGSGAILIVRHPYRCIVADYKLMRTKSHTGQLHREDFASRGWEGFATKRLRAWYLLNSVYLRSVRPLLVVHYNDVRADATAQLRRIARFLRVDAASDFEERLSCAVRYIEGDFHRPSATAGDAKQFDPFSDAFKALAESYVATVGELLQDGGHPPMPVTDPADALPVL